MFPTCCISWCCNTHTAYTQQTGRKNHLVSLLCGSRFRLQSRPAFILVQCAVGVVAGCDSISGGVIIDNVLAAHPEDAYPGAKEYMEALQIAIAALRGPTREQVEALRGEWIKHDGYTECSKCEHWYPSGEVEEEDDRTTFCPHCGAKMEEKTDET